MRRCAFTLLVLTVGLLPACQKRVTPEEESAVFATIRENLAAMESEDIDAVMGTIHSESPQFEATHDLVQMLFEQFDLKYSVSDLKVVGRDKDEVRVSFVQRTERKAGPVTFKNNLVIGVHALRQEDGRWKIHSTPSLKTQDVPATAKPQ